MGKNTFDVLMFAISCIALTNRFAWLVGSDRNRQRVNLLAILLWCVRPADMHGVIDRRALMCKATQEAEVGKILVCIDTVSEHNRQT